MKQEWKEAAERQALLTKREAEIASLNRQVEWLTQQLRLMRGQKFGASSEQTQVFRKAMCGCTVHRGMPNTPWCCMTTSPAGRESVPAAFLEGFTGLLHTGGYEAYHGKFPPEITVAGCWAHMRRKFTDTLKSLPQELRDKSPTKTNLDYCDKLFRLESNFTEQKLSFQERYQVRLEQPKPVVEQFFAWAKAEYEKNSVPKSMFGAALAYTVNQESWLMNIFLDGLELSNNRAERAVRPFAVGRKNWLFSNTPKGAGASAAIYSIVETAKANSLRPFPYLKFPLESLFRDVPTRDCLPWSPTVQNLCK